MPITYQQEPLYKVRGEAEILAHQEWEETTKFKEDHPFEIDWELYETLEEANALTIFTARDGDKLVGYFSVLKSPDIHSKGNFVYCNDAIFLHRDHRKGFVGVKLIKFVERCLKEDGCNTLQITFTTHHDIGNLLSFLGYKSVEIKFEKRLK